MGGVAVQPFCQAISFFAESGSPDYDYAPAGSLIARLGSKVRWDRTEATYTPRFDLIYMPDKDRFLDRAGRYSGHRHGYDHWTDHPKRLKRNSSTDLRTEAKWMEGLLAELTTVFVLVTLELPQEDS